ncbi:hypothetical protein NE865_12558 [Phthorimaea operculella]|nr:hypothetical protein NE865_12558 [Phthorimaea operculella]
MGRKDKPKKRKKDPANPGADSDPEDSDVELEQDKYRPYKVNDYSRKYPETSDRKDFVVFLKHQVDQKPFSDNDKVALSQALRKHAVSGVLHLRPVNRYKVAITFDLSNNANMFLNSKILDELSLYASIPAAGTEITGVVKSVPVNLSNKKIFSLIGSSRNVVQVRRFMRRKVEGGQVTYTPTQTVAVTFASTQLPEHVFLDSWRHEQKLLIMTMCQQKRHVMANNFNFEAITVSLIVLMGCWWSTSGTPDPRDHVPVEAARHAE